MRLWSIHPSYLDAKGIVALWREGLLARKVLMGDTKGYRNHPQLARFKKLEDPLIGINAYLEAVFDESLVRGYHFDGTKITKGCILPKMPVTEGQAAYEVEHLKRKLAIRDPKMLIKLNSEKTIRLHPLFKSVKGSIEEWEIIADTQEA